MSYQLKASNMNVRRLIPIALMLGLLLGTPSVSNAQVFWTDWTSAGNQVVSGSLNIFSQAIDVTYSGNYRFAQTNGGTNYWNYDVYDVDGPGTRPPNSDMVALDYSATHTLTFSSPVVDPYFAIVSLGRTNLPVSYAFSDPFSFVDPRVADPNYTGDVGYWAASGQGWFTASADNRTLTGYEGHGVIQFQGTFESLTWSSTPNEYWHGITVGAAGSVVPEPGTVILMATGLLGIGFMAHRRRREDEEV